MCKIYPYYLEATSQKLSVLCLTGTHLSPGKMIVSSFSAGKVTAAITANPRC